MCVYIVHSPTPLALFIYLIFFQLHNMFKKVCQRYNVVGVDQSEFINMCSLLDTRGIISTKKGKEPRLMKVHFLFKIDLCSCYFFIP